MPMDNAGGDRVKVSYAKGHESYAAPLIGVDPTHEAEAGGIPRGSDGANERLTQAKGHPGNVEVDGVPSAAGGAVTQESTMAGTSGALGNHRVSKWGTEDLA